MKALMLLLALWLSLTPRAHAAVVCDGVNDIIDTGVAFSSFASASTATLALWYKPTGTADGSGSANCYGGERVYVTYNTATGGPIGIYRNGDLSGTDRLCVSNYTASEQKVESTYTNNVWTHLVLVHTGGNLYLYKDGAVVSSVASGDTVTVAEQLKVCQGGEDGNLPGEGVLTDVRVYSTALSAAHIAALAGSRQHMSGPGTQTGYWRLDSCAAGSACDSHAFKDLSGNGRAMTGGAAGTGGTGQSDTHITYPWGAM